MHEMWGAFRGLFVIFATFALTFLVMCLMLILISGQPIVVKYVPTPTFAPLWPVCHQIYNERLQAVVNSCSTYSP